MIEISVVTTLYYSEAYIGEFIARITKALELITDKYEIVLVDDGSPDKSLNEAIKYAKASKKIKIVELSRNFGHHKAIMAGLEHAKGEEVFLIDSDLEEAPELISLFHQKKQENKELDVVYGYTDYRHRSFLNRLFSRLFYFTINYLSNVAIPANATMARLMNDKYVKALLSYNESHLFIGGLMQLSGFKQLGVPVEKTYKGKSSYTFLKRIISAADAIFSFSGKPLVLLFLFGIFICFVSFLWIIYIVISKVLAVDYSAGWASTIASIWFIGGLIIASVALVGLYVSKIFIQVKNRPNYIVRKFHNFF